jgi:hypothetical protein
VVFLRIRLNADHKYKISDDKMITQILYYEHSKLYASVVTGLKVEMVKEKLDLEATLQNFWTIYSTLKQQTI